MKLTDFFQVKPNQRCVIVGMTGSGKSQFAQFLCSEFNSLIVLDYKHEINWEGFKILHSESELSKVGLEREYNRVIFRVPVDWEEEDYDRFFKFVLRRGNTRVYADEGMTLGTNSSFPKHLKIITVVGRSLGVGLIITVQRPATIPTFLMSDSEHKFIFYLSRKEDRKKVEEYCEVEIDWNGEIPHESYRFLHVRAGKQADGPYRLRIPQE